jgi:hypothetical protein
MKKLISILVAAAIIVGLVLLWPIMIAPGTGETPSAAVRGDIIINEAMTSNKGIYPDDAGNSSDWVELYNTADHAVDISRYMLSDDEAEPGKWIFPQMALEAHSYFVIYLSGDTKSDVANGILHCAFRLSAQGETLIFSDTSGNKVDSVDIPALPDNVSYGLVDGAWQQMGHITPGYENSDAGYAAFAQSMTVGDSPLLITEVMAANAMTIADAQGAYSDWVEVTNIGAEAL